ncbi:hypothetical protein [Burkholderia plantarii]|uniref:hypothetical protein n=1 Tax=Burkholderia plantarii TaxID=41899 RepID=UPI000A5A9A7E|nr:hypothetical protein [Burkholderia plantarii]
MFSLIRWGIGAPGERRPDASLHATGMPPARAPMRSPSDHCAGAISKWPCPAPADPRRAGAGAAPPRAPRTVMAQRDALALCVHASKRSVIRSMQSFSLRYPIQFFFARVRVLT